MNYKPSDLDTRSRELRTLRRLDPDGFLRKTFTLPVEEARATARASPRVSGGRLHDYRRGGGSCRAGEIEFTMRRLPTAD